jgi:hypothetical protein
MLSLKRRADFAPPATKRFKLPRYRKSRLTFLDDIPAEIRNKIYELLLVVAEPIDILSLACPNSFQRPPQKLALSPALLCTCQQIFHEAGGILYGMNNFAITIRTRPSILRRDRELWRALSDLDSDGDSDSDAVSDSDSDVVCLSDRPRPKFSNPRSMPITNFRISLAPPAELRGKDTEAYHENLLLDVCTEFLPMAKTFILSTREIEDAMEKRGNKRWRQRVDDDFQRNREVLSLALAITKPRNIIVDSKIWKWDPGE